MAVITAGAITKNTGADGKDVYSANLSISGDAFIEASVPNLYTITPDPADARKALVTFADDAMYKNSPTAWTYSLKDHANVFESGELPEGIAAAPENTPSAAPTIEHEPEVVAPEVEPVTIDKNLLYKSAYGADYKLPTAYYELPKEQRNASDLTAAKAIADRYDFSKIGGVTPEFLNKVIEAGGDALNEDGTKAYIFEGLPLKPVAQAPEVVVKAPSTDIEIRNRATGEVSPASREDALVQQIVNGENLEYDVISGHENLPPSNVLSTTSKTPTVHAAATSSITAPKPDDTVTGTGTGMLPSAITPPVTGYSPFTQGGATTGTPLTATQVATNTVKGDAILAKNNLAYAETRANGQAVTDAAGLKPYPKPSDTYKTNTDTVTGGTSTPPIIPTDTAPPPVAVIETPAFVPPPIAAPITPATAGLSMGAGGDSLTTVGLSTGTGTARTPAQIAANVAANGILDTASALETKRQTAADTAFDKLHPKIDTGATSSPENVATVTPQKTAAELQADIDTAANTAATKVTDAASTLATNKQNAANPASLAEIHAYELGGAIPSGAMPKSPVVVSPPSGLLGSAASKKTAAELQDDIDAAATKAEQKVLGTASTLATNKQTALDNAAIAPSSPENVATVTPRKTAAAELQADIDAAANTAATQLAKEATNRDAPVAVSSGGGFAAIADKLQADAIANNTQPPLTLEEKAKIEAQAVWDKAHPAPPTTPSTVVDTTSVIKPPVDDTAPKSILDTAAIFKTPAQLAAEATTAQGLVDTATTTSANQNKALLSAINTVPVTSPTDTFADSLSASATANSDYSKEVGKSFAEANKVSANATPTDVAYVAPTGATSALTKEGVLDSAKLGTTTTTEDTLTEQQVLDFKNGILPTTYYDPVTKKNLNGTSHIDPITKDVVFTSNDLILYTIPLADIEKQAVIAQISGVAQPDGSIKYSSADTAATYAEMGKAYTGAEKVVIGKTFDPHAVGADGLPIVNKDGTKGAWVDVTKDPVDVLATAKNGMLTTDKINALNLTDANKVTTIDTTDKSSLSSDAVGKIVDGTHSQDVNVAPDSLVSHRLAGLLSANNPYIQQARNDATLQSSRRGMLNSGAAAGYAQDAAIKSGYQIAQGDANVYAAAQQANAVAANALISAGMNDKVLAAGSDAATHAGQLAANATATNLQSGKAYDASVNAIEGDAKTTAAQANIKFNADMHKEESQANIDAGFSVNDSTKASNAQALAISEANKNAQFNATLQQNGMFFDATATNDAAKFNATNMLDYLKTDQSVQNAEKTANFNALIEAGKLDKTLQAQINDAIFKQVGAELAASNDESNTMKRLIASGNIELATQAAADIFTKQNASNAATVDMNAAKLQNSFAVNTAATLANVNASAYSQELAGTLAQMKVTAGYATEAATAADKASKTGKLMDYQAAADAQSLVATATVKAAAMAVQAGKDTLGIQINAAKDAFTVATDAALVTARNLADAQAHGSQMQIDAAKAENETAAAALVKATALDVQSKKDSATAATTAAKDAATALSDAMVKHDATAIAAAATAQVIADAKELKATALAVKNVTARDTAAATDAKDAAKAATNAALVTAQNLADAQAHGTQMQIDAAKEANTIAAAAQVTAKALEVKTQTARDTALADDAREAATAATTAAKDAATALATTLLTNDNNKIQAAREAQVIADTKEVTAVALAAKTQTARDTAAVQAAKDTAAAAKQTAKEAASELASALLTNDNNKIQAARDAQVVADAKEIASTALAVQTSKDVADALVVASTNAASVAVTAAENAATALATAQLTNDNNKIAAATEAARVANNNLTTATAQAVKDQTARDNNLALISANAAEASVIAAENAATALVNAKKADSKVSAAALVDAQALADKTALARDERLHGYDVDTAATLALTVSTATDKAVTAELNRLGLVHTLETDALTMNFKNSQSAATELKEAQIAVNNANASNDATAKTLANGRLVKAVAAAVQADIDTATALEKVNIATAATKATTDATTATNLATTNAATATNLAATDATTATNLATTNAAAASAATSDKKDYVTLIHQFTLDETKLSNSLAYDTEMLRVRSSEFISQNNAFSNAVSNAYNTYSNAMSAAMNSDTLDEAAKAKVGNVYAAILSESISMSEKVSRIQNSYLSTLKVVGSVSPDTISLVTPVSKTSTSTDTAAKPTATPPSTATASDLSST